MTRNQTVLEQYEMSLPMVDVVSIGAGGGSIAFIDSASEMMRVGPRSAGADPGPICYGRGGIEPTVTDANVVMGIINPDYFLGGQQRLDADAARDGIGEAGRAPGAEPGEDRRRNLPHRGYPDGRRDPPSYPVSRLRSA